MIIAKTTVTTRYYQVEAADRRDAIKRDAAGQAEYLHTARAKSVDVVDPGLVEKR
jgi:hypothetical protein